MRHSIFVWVFGLAGLAQAVTLERLTTDQITDKSTAIVYAKVLDSYGSARGSMIYTHYRVKVLQTWKSNKSAVTEVMIPGGVAGGLRQSFAGVPALETGKSYLMFLWEGASGAPQLVGLTQGLFDVAADETGALVASRPVSKEQMLDANGRAVQDQPVRLSFKDLSQRMGTTLKLLAVH